MKSPPSDATKTGKNPEKVPEYYYILMVMSSINVYILRNLKN